MHESQERGRRVCPAGIVIFLFVISVGFDYFVQRVFNAFNSVRSIAVA